MSNKWHLCLIAQGSDGELRIAGEHI
jgi:hypothetical protein